MAARKLGFCAIVSAHVDDQREGFHILDERREKPPAHQREMPGGLVPVHTDMAWADGAHNRHRLGRGDVVARREIGLLDIVEQAAHRFRRQGDGKATAHFRRPFRDLAGFFNFLQSIFII